MMCVYMCNCHRNTSRFLSLPLPSPPPLPLPLFLSPLRLFILPLNALRLSRYAHINTRSSFSDTHTQWEILVFMINPYISILPTYPSISCQCPLLALLFHLSNTPRSLPLFHRFPVGVNNLLPPRSCGSVSRSSPQV